MEGIRFLDDGSKLISTGPTKRQLRLNAGYRCKSALALDCKEDREINTESSTKPRFAGHAAFGEISMALTIVARFECQDRLSRRRGHKDGKPFVF